MVTVAGVAALDAMTVEEAVMVEDEVPIAFFADTRTQYEAPEVRPVISYTYLVFVLSK
jgi:hypothetical protein